MRNTGSPPTVSNAEIGAKPRGAGFSLRRTLN